ncbi:MAG: UDP-N-acetylglucosamine--N-acetylmuramyl-(pentapeptide) pyrophosphoryl-undecaprenol [Acidimicrobiaceae bacterium]|nr:UDP-N-acetylglucosamine--N-acetylmuramyl-(pentapeptide) pyrophosphoryl-undecaprenol [Acidimicrobiaceae bacterium]
MGSQFGSAKPPALPDGAEALSSEAWAVVAGGGTGGHVQPALAIAHALVARGHRADEIHFVGAARGMEARMVPEAGFRITLLPGRGIARRLTVDNVGAVIGLVRAVVKAVLLVRRLRPKVMVTVGGYASVPAFIGALVWRVPLVLHEQNAVPGLANRLASRFAKACAISVPGTPLPRAELTGNPVRAEVEKTDRSYAARARAREALGIPHARRVIGVFGGSLGARRINQAVHDLAGLWSGRADVAIRHVVGSRDWPGFTKPQTDSLLYEVVEYEGDMPLFYAASDVVVSRSGGNTVAELAAVGAPAILVPLPGAPGDHQTANAKALADRGAAVLVPDAECTAERLAAELDPLLRAPGTLDAMGRAARALAQSNAADRVAELAERHARR